MRFLVTDSLIQFLSTPSARRATGQEARGTCPRAISIHALREEGDQVVRLCAVALKISIHALREEGDPLSDLDGRCVKHISIHALREEGDVFDLDLRFLGLIISIHALREEGDYAGDFLCTSYDLFLSTPSARRATLPLWQRWAAIS